MGKYYCIEWQVWNYKHSVPVLYMRHILICKFYIFTVKIHYVYLSLSL